MSRICSLTILLMMGCSSDHATTKFNSQPVITIISHTSGALLVAEEVYTFRAQVSDANHAHELLEVQWMINERVVCDWTPPSDQGEASCELVFEETEDTVVANTRDPEGAAAQDQLTNQRCASAAQRRRHGQGAGGLPVGAGFGRDDAAAVAAAIVAVLDVPGLPDDLHVHELLVVVDNVQVVLVGRDDPGDVAERPAATQRGRCEHAGREASFASQVRSPDAVVRRGEGVGARVLVARKKHVQALRHGSLF